MSRSRLARERRLGLRDRVALSFAMVGLLLTVVLAVGAALTVSHFLNGQSERAAIAEADDNATLLRTKVVTLDQDPGTVMDQLQFPTGVGAVLLFKGERYPSPGEIELEPPESIVRQVQLGTMVHTRVQLAGQEWLVVGVPFQDRRGDAFFELRSLHDLKSTLRTLWVIILIVAAGTAMLGLVLGRLVSRRVTRPLSDVTSAAAAIAHGDLSARLSPAREPDLAELARSFNRTAERLENRVRADARFAGDVSHQLRTPLTTMLNSLAVLQNRRHDLPSEVAEPLAMLEEDLTRFRKLVVDLLEISRADSVTTDHVELVDVAQLVRRAADAVAGRPVTRLGPGVGGLRMHTDKRRLEQVLVNLVGNAETHGGGCRQVLVERFNHTLRIAVDDDGPGVPVEQRERVFDRFVRLDRGGSPGSGLGLAIVERHVSALGGQVRVVDGPDGGARFVVELPVRRTPVR